MNSKILHTKSVKSILLLRTITLKSLFSRSLLEEFIDFLLNSLLSLFVGEFNVLSVFLSVSSVGVVLGVSDVLDGSLGLPDSVRVGSDASMDFFVQLLEGLDFSVGEHLLGPGELLVVVSLGSLVLSEVFQPSLDVVSEDSFSQSVFL